MQRLARWVPLLVVLAAIFALGYPIAFLAGYPMAQTQLEDRTRWFQKTLTARPPLDITDATRLEFGPEADLDQGLLVREGAPFDGPYEVAGDGVHLPDAERVLELADLNVQPDGTNRVFRVERSGQGQPLYLDGRLMVEAYEKPPEKPDGKRMRFTFTGTEGAFVLRGERLVPEEDYTLEGTTLVLKEAPGIWLALRAEPDWARPLRVTGDHAWADDSTLVFRQPPPAGAEIELAERVVRWAERLRGEVNGINRTFQLARPRVMPADPERRIYVDDALLSASGRRPRPTPDGSRTAFTFPRPGGIITLDGHVLAPGKDYTQDGDTVTLFEPPSRRNQLAQHDYVIRDADASRLLLADAPEPGSVVWTDRYTIYDRPKCGTNLVECFLALPQHPVPLPHWIFTIAPDYLTRYDWSSDRNVARQVFYTARGTLVALLTGGAVGLVLAILFVLIRPLERALLPWVIASQTVPIIALVPMLVLILANFGVRIQTSILPTAIIGGYLSFFPISIGAAKGLRSVDPLSLDLMRSYAAKQRHVFFKLRLFAAMPFIFASFKVGAAASLVGALIAETETSNAKGLGFAILGQVQAGNVADLWILFILSSLMGIVFVTGVGWLERLIAPWVRKA